MTLDWAKVVDSINPESMLASLSRSGLRANFGKLLAVGSIYFDRVFEVKECGVTAEQRAQTRSVSAVFSFSAHHRDDDTD